MSATADEKPPLRFHDDENPSMTRLLDHLAFGNKEEKMIRKTDEKFADVEQIQSKNTNERSQKIMHYDEENPFLQRLWDHLAFGPPLKPNST